MDHEPSPSSVPPSDDAFKQYFRRAAAERENIVSRPTLSPENRSMRFMLIGIFLGAFASALFGLVALFANWVILLDVPFAHNIVFLPLFLLICWTGTIIILFVITSVKTQTRIMIWMAILLALACFGFNAWRTKSLFGGMMTGIVSFAILLIPLFAVLVSLIPFGLLVHWAASEQVKHFYQPIWYWKRLIPILALFAMSLLTASLFIYSPEEQKATRSMNKLMQQGITAIETKGELPGELTSMIGPRFERYASGPYQLVPQHNLPIPQVDSHGIPMSMDVYVGARFQSGYYLTCRFTKTGTLVWCVSEWEPPISEGNG